jgi:TPR repeat protein
VIALLVWKQWSVIKDSARIYGERAGILRPAQTQAPQTAAAEVANPPAEVSEGNITVNNDAAPITKDEAAPPEDPSLPPKKKAETKPSAQEDDGNIQPKSEPAPVASTAAQDAQVELAQRYLHGRGVVQDCARGMSLLRSAAAKASTKARIQLGALYATGHCVTQDRATAYRWFAQAQELEPENSYVNRNMNSLWAGMTSAERRRAEAQ